MNEKIVFFCFSGITTLALASNNYENAVKININPGVNQNISINRSKVELSKIDRNKKISHVSYVSCDKYCSVTFNNLNITKRENYKILITQNEKKLYDSSIVLIPNAYQPVINLSSNLILNETPAQPLTPNILYNNFDLSFDIAKIGLGLGGLLVEAGLVASAPIAISGAIYFTLAGIYGIINNNALNNDENKDIIVLNDISNKLSQMKVDISDIKNTLDKFFSTYKDNELEKNHFELIENINKIDSVNNQYSNAIFFRKFDNTLGNIKGSDDKYYEELFANLEGFPELGKNSEEIIFHFKNISSKLLTRLNDDIKALPTNKDYRKVYEEYNSVLLNYSISLTLAIEKAYLLNKKALRIIKKNPSYTNKILIGDQLTGNTFDEREDSLKEKYSKRLSIIKDIKDFYVIRASSFNLLDMYYPGQEFLNLYDFSILYSIKDYNGDAWLITHNIMNKNNIRIINERKEIFRNITMYPDDFTKNTAVGTNYIINYNLSSEKKYCISIDQDNGCILYINKETLDSRLQTSLKQYEQLHSKDTL